MRLCTYNVHAWSNASVKATRSEIIGSLHKLNADVLALNEATGDADRIRLLARTLNSHSIFGPADGSTFGNVLFSKYPIVKWHSCVVDSDRSSSRSFILAVVRVPGVPPSSGVALESVTSAQIDLPVLSSDQFPDDDNVWLVDPAVHKDSEAATILASVDMFTNPDVVASDSHDDNQSSYGYLGVCVTHLEHRRERTRLKQLHIGLKQMQLFFEDFRTGLSKGKETSASAAQPSPDCRYIPSHLTLLE